MFLKSILCGLLVLCLIFPLAACSSNAQDEVALPGTSWRLLTYQLAQPIERTTITLTFEEETLGGSAGCNQYGGGYQLEGSLITIRRLRTTTMFCMGPAGVMEQESMFLQLLQSVNRLELQGGQLHLSGPDDQTLVFEAIS